MAEISGFVVIDANNVAGWPEGMPFNQVNNAERKDEGLLARWYQDTNVVFPPRSRSYGARPPHPRLLRTCVPTAITTAPLD